MRTAALALLLSPLSIVHAAPAGKQEAAIRGKTRKEVSAAIAELARPKKLEVKEGPNGAIVLESEIDDLSRARRSGALMSKKVERLTLTLSEEKDGVIRVACVQRVVKNPGRANEEVFDKGTEGRKRCQTYVDRLQESLKQ